MQNKASTNSSVHGFTLIELSIVIVIIGLLIGGILGGQSLIRSAALQSVISDFNKYKAAATQFKDQYNGLPGDLADATDYWGKDNSNCSSNTGSIGSPGTCNGNGDSMINWAAGPGVTGESMQFWKQLALANLIGGRYTGISTVNYYSGDLGVTFPVSRIGTAGWTTAYLGTQNGHVQWFDGTYGNVLFFGKAEGYTSGVILTPQEAWNIDTKMDDGKPAIGSVRSWRHSYHANCTDVDTTAAVYSLTYTAAACALIFGLD